MQENDIKITIRTLLNLGQTTALISLRDNLKRDYELVEDAVRQINKVKEEYPIKDKVDIVEEKNDSKYDPSWTFINKFLYVLKRERRFLKFRDAARIIIEIEGFGNETELAGKLTSGTKSIKDDGTIVKVKPGKSLVYTYWGSPKWLDASGNIKPEFMYNENLQTTETSKDAKLFDL